MTRDDHYRNAERLLQRASDLEIPPEQLILMTRDEQRHYHLRQMRLFTRAQTHALLARGKTDD